MPQLFLAAGFFVTQLHLGRVALEPRVQTLICARVNQLVMLEMIIPPLNRESLLDGYI